MNYKYYNDEKMKIIRSEEFNMFFNKETGYTVIYGKDENDDVDFCPFGPMIADIEITTSCFGINGSVCVECYKSNTSIGEYMSFETFKKVFSKFPNTLTQIAFGVDSRAETNPDIWKIFSYCRENGVVPNLTVADISDETAKNIKKYCGAVAVSCYKNKKEYCYNSIKRLTDLGMNQVNIHFCLHEDTFDFAIEVLNDMKNDERLRKLNAIVFLQLKRKGRGKNLKCISNEKFEIVMNKAFENKFNVGLDSCGGNKFSKYLEKNGKQDLKKYVTGCESTLQSIYCNVRGEFFPCSFTEGESGYENGIDMLKVNDFIKDVWYNEKTIKFRNSLGNNCFSQCPIFEV